MTDEELKSKFRAFSDAVRREFEGELHLVKRKPTKRILEYNRGSVTWEDYIRPQFGSFFRRNHESIRDLQEYDDCIDFAIENYDVISKYHNNRRGLGEILISFVTDVFAETTQTSVFSENDFQSVYPEYENDLLTKEFPVRSFIPLHGFDYEGEKIELGRNSRIRRVEESDIELVTDFESPTGGSVPEVWDSSSTHFLFELEQTVEKTVNSVGCGTVGFEELEEAQHSIRSVITALRLSFPGEVGYSNHYDHTPCAWGGGITTRSRTVRPMFFVKSMEAGETERLKHLYDMMRSIDFESLEPNLKMSIDRFNSSYIRESENGRIC